MDNRAGACDEGEGREGMKNNEALQQSSSIGNDPSPTKHTTVVEDECQRGHLTVTSSFPFTHKQRPFSAVTLLLTLDRHWIPVSHSPNLSYRL